MRGLKTRMRINTKPAGLGSFVPVHRVPNLTVVSNVILHFAQPPTLLKAPGTFARLSCKNNIFTLLFKNKRTLLLPQHA